MHTTSLNTFKKNVLNIPKTGRNIQTLDIDQPYQRLFVCLTRISGHFFSTFIFDDNKYGCFLSKPVMWIRIILTIRIRINDAGPDPVAKVKVIESVKIMGNSHKNR